MRAAIWCICPMRAGTLRYFTQMFKFNLIYQIIHGPHETGTINTTIP